MDLRLADWQEVEQLIAQQRGKVVVLDVWSTWCVPCVREFPELVALQEQYPDQVVCISFNCNYMGAAGELPEESQPEVLAFLQRQKATDLINVISTTPDDQLMTILDIAAVPAVRVYDAQGELHKQFVNDDVEYGEEGFTYQQHIQPLVAELIGM